MQRRYHQNVLTNAGNYWVVEWTIEYNPDTWQAKILNQGYRQIVSGVRRNILIDGAPATAPVPLDSSGVALVPPVDSSNIVVLAFDIYPAINFGTTFASFGTIFF